MANHHIFIIHIICTILNIVTNSCLQTCTVATWWQTTRTTRAGATGELFFLGFLCHLFYHSACFLFFQVFSVFCKVLKCPLPFCNSILSNYPLSTQILPKITFSLGLPPILLFLQLKLLGKFILWLFSLLNSHTNRVESYMPLNLVFCLNRMLSFLSFFMESTFLSYNANW